MIWIIPTDLLGVFLATGAAFFFAVNMIIIRKATLTGEPIDAVIASVWINALVFFPLMLIFHFPDINLTPKILAAFVIDGLLGTFLARVFLYTGVKEVGASRTVPLSQGNLLVSTLFGVLILGEIITSGHIAGIIFLTIGVVVVSYEIESDNSEEGWRPSIGLLFGLGAMVFLGLSAPFGKIGFNHGAPILVGISTKALAGLCFLSTYLYIRGNSPLRPFKAPEKKLYILIGLAQTTGFGLLYSALNIARVTVVVPFRSLTPFFVLIMSYIYLKKLEKINWIIATGATLTVTGAILVSVFM